MKEVLISFREWLHSYRNVTGIVRAITIQFSSLSESGFIPTDGAQSRILAGVLQFSSLSESGFIPTRRPDWKVREGFMVVLISFREWLHSYTIRIKKQETPDSQVVLISFREWLHSYKIDNRYAFSFRVEVLISFREWLHSYIENNDPNVNTVLVTVLISFREWLHSYTVWFM